MHARHDEAARYWQPSTAKLISAGMSLSFIGAAGGFERRWIVYALLRDNVQHHLEGGVPSEKFAALHSISAALGAGATGVEVPAQQLALELRLIQEQLASVPIADLAISLRTRAVTTGLFPLPAAHATDLARVVGWSIPFPTGDAATVGQMFAPLVDELLAILGDGPGMLRVVDT